MTYRVKRLKVSDGLRLNIDEFPSFHKSGSVKGMRENFYGKDALLVMCGDYIYHVGNASANFGMNVLTRGENIYYNIAY